MMKLSKKGIIPAKNDKKLHKEGKMVPFYNRTCWMMGQCAGMVNEITPARQIIEEMMLECVAILRRNSSRIQPLSKL